MGCCRGVGSKAELRQHQTLFLGALAALSADYLEAGNITEVEHQARLQAYLTAQNELLSSLGSPGAKSELGQLLGTPYAVFPNCPCRFGVLLNTHL